MDLSKLSADELTNLPSQQHPLVKVVVLRRQYRSGEGAEGLCQALTNHTTFPMLEELLLFNIQLDSSKIDMLCLAIASRSLDCTWRKVSLIRCHLFPQGCRKIFQAINGNPLIELVNITGNYCGDGTIPFVVQAITKPENRLQVLDLCSNELGPAGLAELSKAVGNSMFKVQCLQLANNPSIAEQPAAVEGLFTAMVLPGLPLSTLSLPHCNLSSAKWSRFMPFIRCLQCLDLSHNLLDDNAFMHLCITLEHCSVLYNLNLAYNHFSSAKCTVIEQLLANNQSLQYLSLDGNRFAEPVWTAIAHGLAVNKALITLNLTDCALTVDGARELAKAFLTNDLVTLTVQLNALPADLAQDIRGYFHRQSQVYLELSSDAALRSMAAAQEWRMTEERLVRMSVDSQPHADGISDTASTADKYAYYLSVISSSSYCYSEADLDKVSADAHKAHASTNIFVDIVIGRASGLQIGHVQIHALTTYDTVRAAILPLIEEYTRSAGQQAVEEFKNFSMIDTKGNKISNEEAKKRKVWSEIWDQDEPCIPIRPSTWMSFSDQADVDENANEYG